MKAIFVVVSMLLSAACAYVGPSSSARPLLGNWRYADEVQSCQYSFKNDGSFTGEVRIRAKLVSKFTGRWSVSGPTLSYRYHDQLLEVKSDSFVIQAANGERRRYLRVR
jgi:hypothetical protein